MTTRMKTLMLGAATALLAACGGAPDTAAFRAAAPTYETLAMGQSDGDVVAPVAAAPAQQPSPALTVETSANLTTTDCHPHLFDRSHAAMARLNRHFWKQLHHVRELIADHPSVADGQEHVWESLKNGLDRKFTMQRTTNTNGTLTYTFELDMKSGTMTAFAKVMSGSITVPAHAAATAGAAAVATERSGTITYDFTALAQAIPTEHAQGQVVDAWSFLHDPSKPGAGEKNSKSVQLVNFVPELLPGEQAGPKNASYEYEREPGIGGKLTFQDQIVFVCDNPNGLAADVTDVARWYVNTDGTVHGRADAKAVNGPVAPGGQWVGYTCGITATSTTPAEGEWLLKEEGSTGASSTYYYAQSGTSPCDPIFGVVPDKTDSANDYNFSAAVTFPNEW